MIISRSTSPENVFAYGVHVLSQMYHNHGQETMFFVDVARRLQSSKKTTKNSMHPFSIYEWDQHEPESRRLEMWNSDDHSED
jgi:hypothetical protein